MKTSQLRKIIKESIKGLLIEQTSSECAQINALPNFAGCCEMNYFGNPPGTPTFNNPNSINNPTCKSTMNSAMQISSTFYNCCDPNYTGGGGEDVRGCFTPAQSGATNQGMPCPGSVGVVNLHHEPCCTYEGGGSDDPCLDPNNPEQPNCWYCKSDDCQQTGIMPYMTNADAAAANLNLYLTKPACNNSEAACGPQTSEDIECQKCNMGFPVANMFPGPNCPQGWTLAALFNPKQCKKPGGGIPTNSTLPSKMKPNQGDMRRAIREIKRRINNISKR